MMQSAKRLGRVTGPCMRPCTTLCNRFLSTTQPRMGEAETSTTATIATAAVTIQEGSALDQIQVLDKRAQDLYDKHPLAYHNFPLKKLKWRIASSHKGEMTPQLVFNGNEHSSFTHLTPWALVMKSTVGVRGTLGARRNPKQPHTDYKVAVQDISLGTGPLMPGGPLNEPFLGYMQWVTAIEDSLIDHVAAELNNYTEIAAEVKRLRKGDEDVRQTLERMTTRSFFVRDIASKKHGPAGMRFTLRSKLFVRPRDPVDWENYPYACWLDKDVGTRHHLVRRDVPLFDNNGNLVDLEERRLEPMDVVAVQARFDGHVMRISKGSLLLGLRRQLGSVVRLRPAVYSAKHLLKLGFIRHYGELKSMDV